MGIKITTNELIKLLDTTPPEHNIMLAGKHGIGKSQILEKYFTEKKQKVIILFLGQMSDPGDLIGLPYKDEKTGITNFMAPYWWPVDNKPIVLFLDELNRARPEVLQTVMDLTLNRKLAGKELPKGSRIISAVNAGDEYQLTDLDPALVSRFNIYEFVPSVQEWLLWAQKNKIDQRVIDFISENPALLDGLELRQEDQGLEKTPDRRGWERVSNIISLYDNEDEFQIKAIAGIIGMSTASKFYAFYSSNRLLTAKDILTKDFDVILKKLKSYTNPQIAILNDSIYRFIETAGYKDEEKKTVIDNLTKYVLFLEKIKSKEPMAHFVNLYSSNNYKNTILFIVTNCKDVLKKITDFIKNL